MSATNAIKVDLSAEGALALTRMSQGGKIEARRTFPYPHAYWLVKADGHRYAKPLAVVTVARLLEYKLIEAHALDHPVCDTIDYSITERGLDVQERGGVVEVHDWGQLGQADIVEALQASA